MDFLRIILILAILILLFIFSFKCNDFNLPKDINISSTNSITFNETSSTLSSKLLNSTSIDNPNNKNEDDNLKTEDKNDTENSDFLIIKDFHTESAKSQVNISWNNPVDEDFYGIKICRTESENCEDINISCDPVYVTTNGDNSWIDNNVINDKHYCYKAFAYNNSWKYSDGVTDSAYPHDPYSFCNTYGGSSNDYARSIAVDSNGNIFSGGHFFAYIDLGGGRIDTIPTSEDFYVAKYNKNGVYLWDYTNGSDRFDYILSIDVDQFGNVYAAGYFDHSIDFGISTETATGYDAFVMKLNQDGVIKWVYHPDNNVHMIAYDIKLDKDRNSYIVGYFIGTTDFHDQVINSVGGEDIYVVKLDENGNFQWAKHIASNDDERGVSIDVDENSNCYITGYYTTDIDLGGGTRINKGSSDIYLIKLDKNGNYQWDYTVGTSSVDESYGISIDKNANVYLTGHFYNTINFGGIDKKSNGQSDIFIVSLNQEGLYRWDYVTGSNASDWSFGIQNDSNNNVFITGSYSDEIDLGGGNRINKGNTDIFVLKLSSQGRFYGITLLVVLMKIEVEIFILMIMIMFIFVVNLKTQLILI